MSDLKMGVILDKEGLGTKDAAHVAVICVKAGERLIPGMRVGFTSDFDFETVGVRTKKVIGVVDPFLTQIVEHGQKFWLCLQPGTTNALRHEWDHPALAARESLRVVQKHAKMFSVSPEELLTKIRDSTGGPLFYGNSYDDYPGLDEDALLAAYRDITGEKAPRIDLVEFCC